MADWRRMNKPSPSAPRGKGEKPLSPLNLSVEAEEKDGMASSAAGGEKHDGKAPMRSPVAFDLSNSRPEGSLRLPDELEGEGKHSGYKWGPTAKTAELSGGEDDVDVGEPKPAFVDSIEEFDSPPVLLHKSTVSFGTKRCEGFEAEEEEEVEEARPSPPWENSSHEASRADDVMLHSPVLLHPSSDHDRPLDPPIHTSLTSQDKRRPQSHPTEKGSEVLCSKEQEEEDNEGPGFEVVIRLVKVMPADGTTWETRTCRVSGGTTLRRMKQLVSDETGLLLTDDDPVMLNGENREDMGVTMRALGATAGALFVLVHRVRVLRQKSMRIGARTPGGSVHRVRLTLDMTLRQFKAELLKIPRFQGLMNEATRINVQGQDPHAPSESIEDVAVRELGIEEGWTVEFWILGSRRGGRPGGLTIYMRPFNFATDAKLGL